MNYMKNIIRDLVVCPGCKQKFTIKINEGKFICNNENICNTSLLLNINQMSAIYVANNGIFIWYNHLTKIYKLIIPAYATYRILSELYIEEKEYSNLQELIVYYQNSLNILYNYQRNLIFL